MKRRLLASLLAVCMVVALIPSMAFAANNSACIQVKFTAISETYNGNTTTYAQPTEVELTAGSYPSKYKSVQEILEDIQQSKIVDDNEIAYSLDTSATLTIRIPQLSTTPYEETIAKKVTIFGEGSGTSSGSEDEIYISYPGEIIIQVQGGSGRYKHKNTLTFSGGLDVQEGANLTLQQNQNQYAERSTIDYVFGGDVTVGGSLTFFGNPRQGHNVTSGYVTFAEGATMTVENGANVAIGCVAVTGGNSNDALITVESGGKLAVKSDGVTSYATITTPGTAISVENGGALTVSAGNITADTGAAIEVESGGSITLTTTPNGTTTTPVLEPSITTKNENGQAIDLAPSSTVKAGDATVTVGSAEGDNYVDNSGKIVLASGSVQVGDQTTQLPNGGTVTPADGEGGTTVINPNTVSAESVTLDRDTMPLNLGQTAQLTATVSPESTTDAVTWSSDNTSVATVENGLVTAVGYGTATITATAGGKTATCTVTVAYPYIPVPPVNPTQPTRPSEPDQPDEPDTPVIPGALPFVDISANDWYYEDVAYVYAQGIMTGSTATSFAPNDAMTRAMVWTVLGRMSGEDVEGGSPWYALAQAWAVSGGVSDGTEPNSSITREQLVTMLYRQAGSPKVGVSELALLGRFTDGEAVSAWAEEAMAWAVSQGTLTGDGDLLNPQAAATRAQVAAILARYCEADKK